MAHPGPDHPRGNTFGRFNILKNNPVLWIGLIDDKKVPLLRIRSAGARLGSR